MEAEETSRVTLSRGELLLIFPEGVPRISKPFRGPSASPLSRRCHSEMAVVIAFRSFRLP